MVWFGLLGRGEEGDSLLQNTRKTKRTVGDEISGNKVMEAAKANKADIELGSGTRGKKHRYCIESRAWMCVFYGCCKVR